MKTLPPRRHRGFTIVELSVICSIVSVLLSLSLPAMQSAQDAARNTACKNRMKQIGLALHNYHSVYRLLPASWYARYTNADSRPWMGWSNSILPFLDQAALYNSISDSLKETKASPQWPSDATFATTVVPELRCPADTTADLNPMRGGFATSNYSGNAGSKPFPRLYAGSVQTYWPGGASIDFGPPKPDTQLTAGIFQLNGRVSFRDITDGTSNTISVTERSAIGAAGLWMGVRANQMENDAITEFSPESKLNRSFIGASSFHVDGLNMLLVDGSTRFVSPDIESGPVIRGQLKVLQALAGRSDGTRIGNF